MEYTLHELIEFVNEDLTEGYSVRRLKARCICISISFKSIHYLITCSLIKVE